MKNQFWYTRKIEKAVQVQGQEKQYDEFQDCFNINKVIRGVRMGDEFIIILDDFHERVDEKPEVRNGKIIRYNRHRDTMQSEIHLNLADMERFYKQTNIEL